MAKNIILCSDGTRNKGGVGHPTNVWKLFNGIDLQKYKHSDSVEQVAFYDDGVGTDRLKFLKLIGGAFGWGLTRNVKELYTHLVKNYEAGDHIYLFGFSRGAYTVRTLAGLISRCGVIDKNHWLDKGEAELQRLVDEAYESYRTGYKDRFFDHLRAVLRRLRALVKRRPRPKPPLVPAVFRKDYGVDCKPDLYRDTYQNVDFNSAKLKGKKMVPIRFIGVWDTVDAVGLPFKELAELWNEYIYTFKFKCEKLGPAVNKACHVLSIDDERKTFHPTLFDETSEKESFVSGAAPRIEQVWFPGVHSNVGGGYPKQGLAGVSQDWMVGKAQENGLVFENCALKEIKCSRNIHDKLYDSRSGPAFFYRYAPRDLAEICSGKVKKIRIHVGAFQRIAMQTGGYAPFNLPLDDFEIVPDFSLCKDRSNRGEGPEALKGLVRSLEKNLSAADLAETVRSVKEKKVKQRIFCYRCFIFVALLLVVLGVGYRVLSIVTKSSIVIPAWTGSLGDLLESLLGAIPFIGSLLFKGVVQPLLAMPVLVILCLLTMFLAYRKDSKIKKDINDLMYGVWGQVLEEPWWRSEQIPQIEENLQGEEQREPAALYQVGCDGESSIRMAGGQ